MSCKTLVFKTAVIPGLIAGLSMFMLCACNSRLKGALELAGDNRAVLEKVLQHYSRDKADTLKYKAARFLIENAPYHYCYGGKEVKDYRYRFDSLLFRDSPTREEYIEAGKGIELETAGLTPEWDIQELTADYLISHIDSAFVVMQYPWSKELSFEEFCEYVLPYRVSNEMLDEWIGFYRNRHIETLKSLVSSGADRLTATTTMFDSLSRMYFIYDGQVRMKVELKPSDYLKAPSGLCPEMTKIGLYSMRSIGLPVNYDFIFQWANRSWDHCWNSIMIDGKNHSFVMQDSEFDKHFDYRPQERLGKVYRKMFSFQPQSLPNQKEAAQEEIPGVLNNPFLKDVSQLYFEGVDVDWELSVPFKEKKKLGYLMVFDNRKWVPIGWSKIKRGKVLFKNLEKGCAYMAMYYHDDQFHPASDPFTIDKEGRITIRRPNLASIVTVHLKRKYPMIREEFSLGRAKGGEFQVSNYPDFRKYKTIYTIGDLSEVRPHYINMNDNTEFRYIRYYSAPWAHVFLAEIEFYDQSGTKLQGDIIGTEGSFMNNGLDKYRVFDGEPLTAFDAPEHSGCWVGMAFDKPQTLGSLMFLPFNTDNFIQDGQEYELFYYHEGEPVSLGTKIGDKTHILHYDNVPQNALLLLRNHTKGIEERIFSYEDGQQVWW